VTCNEEDGDQGVATARGLIGVGGGRREGVLLAVTTQIAADDRSIEPEDAVIVGVADDGVDTRNARRERGGESL
jgi:hypothetical protein